MPAEAQPALKEMFNAARYRQIAGLLAEAHPGFDRKRFLQLTTTGLDELSLLQRLRRTTEACRATLPADYVAALAVLRKITPELRHNFIGIFPSDFVGQYGHDHFDASMEALKYFTRFGSAEFAIREFLKRDLHRTLEVMTDWSRDPDEHIRRLASEGCRPRLPWSFQLTELIADPSPVRPILENLRADPALYVRKSVANHLNDISKDHPEWLLDVIGTWDRSQPPTAWIVRHALRTLIKRGERRALAAIGAGESARVKLSPLRLSPKQLAIGGSVEFAFALSSRSRTTQNLVIDYIVHYRKQSGQLSPKAFKLKQINLPAAGKVEIKSRHSFRELSTRRHHPGGHRLEIMINGRVLAEATFKLTPERAPAPGIG